MDLEACVNGETFKSRCAKNRSCNFTDSIKMFAEQSCNKVIV